MFFYIICHEILTKKNIYIYIYMYLLELSTISTISMSKNTRFVGNLYQTTILFCNILGHKHTQNK